MPRKWRYTAPPDPLAAFLTLPFSDSLHPPLSEQSGFWTEWLIWGTATNTLQANVVTGMAGHTKQTNPAVSRKEVLPLEGRFSQP